MTLLHHSSDNFKVAAKRAKGWAETKLNGMIALGRERTQETLEQVDRTLIADAIVPTGAIRFRADNGHVRLGFGKADLGLHPNALSQVVQRLDGSQKAADWACDLEADTAEEFAGILNKKMWRQQDTRYLVRSVDGEARGFLSDSYRRIDARPLVDALVTKAVKELGAVPIDARALDTSFYMKLVLPQLYEPLENEIGVFGLTFQTSDFGKGGLNMKGFFNRLWCTNLAMTEDAIRQVHLGRRLSEDIAFSNRTMELDTAAMASAIGDVVDNIFSPENILLRMMAVKAASEGDDVDLKKLMGGFVKSSKLLKGEAQAVTEAFNSPEIELLPPGQNRWRLSNAISLIAQQALPERQLELESLAGEVAGLARQAA